MNWDAFAQQVAGGIQRGASGWAGTIRSDIERKKTTEESLKIMKAQQEYQDKKQREDQLWDVQKMTIGSGIAQITAQKNAEMQQRMAKDDADYKARIDSLMGDKGLGASWAFKIMNGRRAEADEEYDFMNRIKNGEMSKGPKDAQILARFPAIASGALRETLQKNQDRLLAQKRDQAYIDYMNSNNENIQKKKDWTLPEVMTAYEDSLMKLGTLQGHIDAVQKDTGYQSVISEVARLRQKNPNAPIPANIATRYMSYQQQISNWQGLMEPVMALSNAYKMKMDSFIPKPPEPTDSDKKASAEAEARRKAAAGGGESRGSLLPGKGADTSTYAGRMEAKKQPGRNIFTAIGDLAESTATEKFKQVEVADMFRIDNPSDILVLKNRGDYRDILSGKQRLSPGSYLFDPWKKDLFKITEDGMLVEIPNPNPPKAKNPTKDPRFAGKFW